MGVMKYVAFLLLSAMSLMGCQSVPTYMANSVSQLDKSSLAFIVCDSENRSSFLKGLDKRLYLAEVDGKSTYDFGAALFANQQYPERAWVEPGRHHLRVKYEYFGSYAYGYLWLDAEAGKTYRVKKGVEGYAIRFWIIEQESGDLVGGIWGSEPEEETPVASDPI